MGAVTYPTLEHVAMEARPYPTHLLEGCETGLVLFAAAFFGHNDAIHFAQADVLTTCVDNDRKKLKQMERLYPPEWVFMWDDAWSYAGTIVALSRAGERIQWDAVSVDTFTGHAMVRSLNSLNLWCSLARRFVTVTITDDVDRPLVPDGWTASRYPRSGTVSWLVLEPE